MSQIVDYRQVVDMKTRRIFFNCLKKAIKEIKPKKIGYIGVIESNKEYSHDIDILMFPALDSKIGETIIEVGKIYEKTESILKKHHERFYLSLAPKKIMQEMIYYLSSLEEGSVGLIPIHSLFFTDYHSFKLFNPKNFQKSIQKKLKTLHGDFNIIKKLKKLPQKKLEPYFIILDFEMNAKTKTFPRHLIRTSAESLFTYLNQKYKLGLKKKKLHNLTDIKKEFNILLRYLDKISYD